MRSWCADWRRRSQQEAFARDEFDAVEALAKKLPMMMLGRILGVPDADLPFLVEKGDALIGNTDPDFTDTIVDKVDTEAYRFMPFRSPAGVELYDYAQGVMDGKKDVDPEGILARVLGANDEQGVMEAQDFKNFFCLLVAAGNDTTRYSIAMALYQLTQNPNLLAQLKTGTVWNTAPDEFIRLASPTMHFRRTATEETTLGGKRIAKGDKVILWFVSGNRDKAVFDDPHGVNLARDPEPASGLWSGGRASVPGDVVGAAGSSGNPRRNRGACLWHGGAGPTELDAGQTSFAGLKACLCAFGAEPSLPLSNL